MSGFATYKMSEDAATYTSKKFLCVLKTRKINFAPTKLTRTPLVAIIAKPGVNPDVGGIFIVNGKEIIKINCFWYNDTEIYMKECGLENYFSMKWSEIPQYVPKTKNDHVRKITNITSPIILKSEISSIKIAYVGLY